MKMIIQCPNAFFFLCEEDYIERNMQTLATENLFYAFFIKSVFFLIFR